MKHIAAIFKKQSIDTRKNPVLLLQFLLYPLMVLLLNNLVPAEEIPENMFTEMFSAMFIGMAPLITAASVVAEEKEKGTLRTLLMSGVSPFAYLGGIGLFIFTACLCGSVVIAAQGGYSPADCVKFVLYMCIGCLISETIGAAIGIARPSQTGATGTAVPVMMVFAFLPMISMFNENIEKAAQFTYTYQIKSLISDLSCDTMNYTAIAVMGVSLALALGIFAFLYKRNGLE